MKHCTKPCPACPWGRSVTPGALGGGRPEAFIGQAFGPFFLPCYAAAGYNPATTVPSDPQCAGAAIFRANRGLAKLMPPGIHSLPADTAAVFADEAEFIAHHTGIAQYAVEATLEHFPPELMLAREMNRAGLRVHPAPRPAQAPAGAAEPAQAPA